MFLLDGRIKMRGGDHEMEMTPGDYMYLPRCHIHKVWLESTPEVVWNPDQAKSALKVGESYEADR